MAEKKKIWEKKNPKSKSKKSTGGEGSPRARQEARPQQAEPGRQHQRPEAASPKAGQEKSARRAEREGSCSSR